MSEKIDIGNGQTVQLMTAWQFLNWTDFEDLATFMLPAELVIDFIEKHQTCFPLMVLYSAFGWREIRCRDEAHGEAGVVLWTHPDRQEA